jgi:hypothetical protein
MVPLPEVQAPQVVAPMTPSVVTSRHWVRAGMDETFWSIELRDGAQPVEYRATEDPERMVKIWKRGAYEYVPVWCGPEAPFPARPMVARIGDRLTVVYDLQLGGKVPL